MIEIYLFTSNKEINFNFFNKNKKYNLKQIVEAYILRGMTTYELYFDGCSKGNPGLAGAGAVLYEITPDVEASIAATKKKEIWVGSAFVGENITNNLAEYNGLILGLMEAVKRGLSTLYVFGDSLLIIKQMQGAYAVKAPQLQKCYQSAKSLEKQLVTVTYAHVYRTDNQRADALANAAVA